MKNNKNIYTSKIKLISKDSTYFPRSLLSLSDCPDILFVIGNEKILNNISISIVGTRKSSKLGNELAFNISQNLANQNITIVSGLAKGIDSKAHLGTFNIGTTIGIIACGFNHLDSSTNKLVIDILQNNGAIISEYFPDTPPQTFCYLRRNRLVATISSATIVIEAPIKSGALNTAQTALSYSRKVFALPWNVNMPNGEGCNALIQNKATLLTNYTQILTHLNLPSTVDLPNSIYEKIPYDESSLSFTNIPSEYLEIYKFISKHQAVSKDFIYSNFSNEDISNINSKLTLMELEELIIYRNNKYSCNKNKRTFA